MSHGFSCELPTTSPAAICRYAETVSSSPQHREYYSRAISRVEGELALKRWVVLLAWGS